MRLFAATAAIVAALGAASEAAAADFTLASIGGTWAYGETQWNDFERLGAVDNIDDLAVVDAMLHAPYVYRPPSQGVANAIYSYPTPGDHSLSFLVDDGMAVLESVTILSSRSYTSTTVIALDYSNDGGATWLNALTTTTGAAGWINVGTGRTQTVMLDLAFGGVTGNAFRFFTTGGQINLHNLALTASPVDTGGVPEPATWALMIVGFGAAGAALRRRRAVAA
jgi:hypothetical protein